MVTIELKPIGKVHSPRTVLKDDDWGAVEAWIELESELSAEALDGIDSFSHVEVIYYFDQVRPEKIVRGARHPRNNPDWPKIGIFAQRGKNRPNQLGATICKVLKREQNRLYLQALDAVDGTPVLDIKPVMQGFLPREPVTEPDWSTRLMKDYWHVD